jgi:hypothetical protein
MKSTERCEYVLNNLVVVFGENVKNNIICRMLQKSNRMKIYGETLIANYYCRKQFLVISLKDGKIHVWIPGRSVYECKIDKQYMEGKHVSLMSIFYNIFESLYNKTVISLNELYFMEGLDNLSPILKVYHNCNFYLYETQNGLRRSGVIIHSVEEFIRADASSIECAIIFEDIDKQVLNSMAKLKYLDIRDGNFEPDKKYKSLRINGVQINGYDPLSNYYDDILSRVELSKQLRNS